MKYAVVVLLLSCSLAWAYASIDLYQLRSELEVMDPLERADLVNTILIAIAPFLVDALFSLLILFLTPYLGPLLPLVTPIIYEIRNFVKTMLINSLSGTTATTITAATTAATTPLGG